MTSDVEAVMAYVQARQLGGVFVLLCVSVLLTACPAETTRSEKCGDGVLDLGEVCDTTIESGIDCRDFGYYGGTLRCSDSCVIDTGECVGECGDSVVDLAFSEECDGTNLGGHSCEEFGFSGTLSCSSGCTLDPSTCIQCGDGVVQPELGEECDGGEFGGATCFTLGYYGGQLACTSGCEFDMAECVAAGICGDGVIDAGEELCDGTSMGTLTETCVELGYWGGEVACAGSCDGYDTTDCILATSLSPANEHLCVVDSLGVAYCMGSAEYGKLGRSATADSADYATLQPVIQTETGLITSISAGAQHTCALTAGGEVWCWGMNSGGQLGSSAGPVSLVPTRINVSGVLFVSVSTHANHTCALTVGGVIWCWGTNSEGQLGDGSVGGSRVTPASVQMPAGVQFTEVESGHDFSCALDTNGSAWCWGGGSQGQLGSGTLSSASTPLQIAMPTGVQFEHLSCGNAHVCAATADGEVWCWGNNGDLQTGQPGGGVVTLPAQVALPPGISAITAVTCGYSTSCASHTGGGALCWGDNVYGNLGIGETLPTMSSTPVAVNTAGLGAVSIHGSGATYCARADHGTISCWGHNNSGILGVPPASLTFSATPLAIAHP